MLDLLDITKNCMYLNKLFSISQWFNNFKYFGIAIYINAFLRYACIYFSIILHA